VFDDNSGALEPLGYCVEHVSYLFLEIKKILNSKTNLASRSLDERLWVHTVKFYESVPQLIYLFFLIYIFIGFICFYLFIYLFIFGVLRQGPLYSSSCLPSCDPPASASQVLRLQE
jgi:hypothetical protein